MTEVLSFAEFRSRISITELAIASGYVPNKKHWSKKYPVLENSATGDRIYIVNPDNPGNQGYVNVNDDFDKGTLIDFVRKRLSTDFSQFNRPDKSEFYNINAVLYHYLSLPQPELKRLAPDVQNISTDTNRSINNSNFRVDLLDIKPLRNTYFLLTRGISPTTLRHPNFAGAIYNVEDRNFVNTAFPYYDHSGTTVIGLELRNHNFKQHAENSKKSVGIWHSNPPAKVDQVVFTESGIDALSYHQLHQLKNTLYVSVGGNLTAEQIKTALTYIESLEGGKDARILLAFDQDKEGAKYDLRFLLESNKEIFPGASIRSSKDFLNVEIPLLSKEAERAAKSIEAGLERHNKPDGEQTKGVENPEVKKDIIGLMFQQSEANNIANIRIPSSYQAISFFNSQVLSALNIHHRCKLEKAQNKDFNDDLKLKIKGGQSQNERSAHRGRKM